MRQVSKKRQVEVRKYRKLEVELREKCGNKSELSGEYGDWQTHWNVEGHHITGRTGKKVYDPFNIILLTRPEHDKIKKTHTEAELLALVREIRVKQGYKEA